MLGTTLALRPCVHRVDLRRARALAGPLAAGLIAAGSQAMAATAPVLDKYGPSLTVDPTSSSSHQPAFARLDQRGVDIDGTLRLPVPMGWALAGDPLGGGSSAGRTLGDVMLVTGSYHPTEIDLALPTLGLPVIIGRTYSGVQEDGAGGYASAEGYQGWNWNQIAQPQISLVTGASNDLDILYLFYGNDRFIEFKRTALNSTEFKAKNGAAGVVSFTAGNVSAPELYTYYDQRGDQITFFGFNGAAAHGAGHLWKMADPAGNTAYVYDQASAATAAASGYDMSDRVQVMFDASGRKYLFTYSTFGSTFRLQKVEAQLYASSVWTTIAKVEYDYYTATSSLEGKAGDLRLVTVTMKGVAGADYVRTKYYRYYTGANWADSDGSRGKQHLLKMVVGFDGIRQADSALSISSHNYSSVSDADLLPYAEAYFEYTSNTDWRLKSAIFNGNCGCSGGMSGSYSFTYGESSSYGTYTANTNYDNAWAKRTVIAQPDGTYITQYFDETGAVMGRVITNADPAASPTKTWVSDIERNGDGQVTAIHSPENVSGYTHSTGAITYSSSAGLITAYTRHAASDNLDGLRDSVSVQKGTSGTPSTISSVSMADRQLAVGVSGVSIPQVNSSSTYPSGSALTTSYSYTYHSSTSSNVLYLAPKSITTSNPAVSSGSPQHNGSGSATTSARHLRQDGSTVFTVDAGGIIFYSGRSAFGQVAKTIADCDTTASGDYFTGDSPSTWSLTTSGTAIHAITTMTYDDQGRILSRTQPGVNASRTLAWSYKMDSGRLGTFAYPLYAVATYYGPVSYTRINHAGKVDRRATIDLGGSGSGSAPSATPSNSTWSGMVDSVYDQSGMRLTATLTYTTDSSTYDSAYVYYDAMGRIERAVDATGTITRTVYDERGLMTERWIGTNDSGWDQGSLSGPANVVKVEAREYDNGSAGANGLLTKRSEDSSGAWSGGNGDRVSSYSYDYRGRAIVALNPVSPHTVNLYDNAGRVIASGQYSSSSGLTISTDPTSTSTNRVGLSETLYDERGQVYQSLRWEVNQASGATGSSQVTDNWFDASGRLVKTMGSQVVKTAYDRLGRVTDRFVIAKVDDSTYAHALDVAGDFVLEQAHTARDPSTGMALAQWLIQRAHDDTHLGTTGPLDTNADGDPLVLTSGNLQNHARAQITSMWYDSFDRVTDTVAYGTNGGITFTRTGLTAPTSAAATPRTTYSFDGFGRVYRATDPAGIISQTEFDFAGRKVATIDHYVNGNPQSGAGAANDQDRRVNYTYTHGLVTAVTREMPQSSSAHDNDQETDYEYDTVSGVSAASIIKRKNLLTRIVYPEQSGGQADTDRDVVYIYSALSQVTSTTDPAGNVITTSYDYGGRVTARTITTFASGFDNRVKEIDTSYTPRGQVAGVLQKNAGGTTLDEVSYTYDGWGNLKTFVQDPDSAIGGSGRADYEMDFDYALSATSGCDRALYLTNWAQPTGAGGMAVVIDFNTGIDSYVHRPSDMFDKNSIVLGEYSYLGARTVVGMDYSEPKSGTGTWLYDAGGSSTYSSYMDGFNRPVSVRWAPGISSSATFINQAYEYDVEGNMVSLVDSVLKDDRSPPNNAFDMLFTYDALRRLTERDEGQATGSPLAIASGDEKRLEKSPHNLAGRIITDQINLDWASNSNFTSGSLSAIDGGEMDDSRYYNRRNELTSRTYSDSTLGSPYSPGLTYDKNGNLTDDGEKYQYAFNPFGQLVSITDKNTSKVQAVYTYNGLGMRISEQTDTNNSTSVTIGSTTYSPGSGVADGTVNSTDPVFYLALDMQGRRVATFRGTDTYPKETFIYHPDGVRGPGFAGGLQLRDRNSSLTDPTKWATDTAGSTRSERLYYCADPRGNVIALVTYDAKVKEQYRYSPSGVPFGLPQGNVDSTGTVTGGTSGTDYLIVDGCIGGTYQARADLDLDGSVTTSDRALIVANNGVSLGRGKLSGAAVATRNPSSCYEMYFSGFYTMGLSRSSSMSTGIFVPLATSLTGGSRAHQSVSSCGSGGGSCGRPGEGGTPVADPSPPLANPPQVCHVKSADEVMRDCLANDPEIVHLWLAAQTKCATAGVTFLAPANCYDQGPCRPFTMPNPGGGEVKAQPCANTRYTRPFLPAAPQVEVCLCSDSNNLVPSDCRDIYCQALKQELVHAWQYCSLHGELTPVGPPTIFPAPGSSPGALFCNTIGAKKRSGQCSSVSTCCDLICQNPAYRTLYGYPNEVNCQNDCRVNLYPSCADWSPQ